MSASSSSKKRKLPDSSVDLSELQREEKLLLALDNIPLSTTYAKIEAFFHPTALRGIRKSVDYGALKATEVEFYSVIDWEVVLEKLQGKYFEGQRLFLRSPEDMRAERPGCGWEKVHPILQRELFSHFSVLSRCRLQRVSKLWKHDLSSLDPRVKETIGFRIDGKHGSSNIVFPEQARQSIRHVVFSASSAGNPYGRSDTMVDLPQLFGNCKKITFMNVTYSDKWITLALTSVCRGVEVRFANCRIRLSWLNSTENKPRALLSSSVPINSCELKVRMMCLSVGNDEGVVECCRKLYAALERENPTWDVTVWKNWWTQHKASLDSELVNTIQDYFDSDEIRKFLGSSPSEGGAEFKKDIPQNIRDGAFLRNFFFVKNVSLPAELGSLFPDAEFREDKFTRGSKEYSDAASWLPNDLSETEDEDDDLSGDYDDDPPYLYDMVHSDEEFDGDEYIDYYSL